MANEYAALAELKARMGIDADDTSRDTELQGKLTAASRDIDKDTGRRFWLDPVAVARIYHLRHNVTRDGVLLVDDIGDTTGLTVEVGTIGTATWTTLDADRYEAVPENALTDGEPVTGLLLCSGWGWGGNRVRVTALWGWPAVPEQIKEATLLRAHRLARRKDSPEGVAGNSDFGVVRVSRWDPDYDALIGPFVLPGIG